MAEFKINNIEVSLMGITVLEGVYNELLKLPKPKDTVSNNWKDEHGTERDLINRVYESLVYNLKMVLKGNSVADYLAKRTAFNQMMLNGRFNFKAYELNRSFDLVYTDVANFESKNNICVFTIVCANDFPQFNTPIV